jgi:hypothetical protein
MPGKTGGVCCVKCKINVVDNGVNRKCPCGKRPIYNVNGETKGVCCVKCKTDEMICVTAKMCPGYNSKCPVRTFVRGNKYCMSCDPDEGRRKQFKCLENAFFEYIAGKIDIHNREYRVNFDQNVTSKKFAKVDGIVIGDGIVVCIEVDEDGHKDYECDEHRMHLVNGELLQLYPDHNIAWVRVNPTSNSTKTRNKRFDDVIKSIICILETKKTEVVYIGFN